MAAATPSRRALGDLPINTFGTPPKTGMIGKLKTGIKRQIYEVDKLEYGQAASRVRLSPAFAQRTAKEDISLTQASSFPRRFPSV